MADLAYWALAPKEEIGAELVRRVRDYYGFFASSPIGRRILLARRLTFGLEGKAGSVSWEVRRGGAAGELAKMRSGHFGNLSEQRVTMATQQKPAWTPIASNSDYASLAQTTTASTVLDYIYRQHRIERALVDAGRSIQWSGEGFISGGWDARKGNTVAEDPDTGEEIKDGDFEAFRTPTTLDVWRDPLAASWQSMCWSGERDFVNKYDVAAAWPEHAEAICSISTNWLEGAGLRADSTESKSDQIPLFRWYHDKTPAVPQGRFVLFAASDIVLFDGPLPFRLSPLKRGVEKELDGTPFGWSAMFDAMGPQEVVDALTTAIVTQQTTNAVRKLIGVKGSGINWRQITQALGVIEVKSMDMAPKPLDFTDVSEQVFGFRGTQIQEMQMFAGVNDMQRGVISDKVKSGAQGALYDAISLRAASPLASAIKSLSEDVGTFALHTLADYAGDSERVASIAGEQNRTLVTKFKGSDLAGFERVTVEASDHMGKTMTGKQAWADQLLEKGALGQGEVAGQRYIALAKTGSLDQLTEAPHANALRIKRDKELLAKGIGLPPMVPVSDPLTGAPVVDPMTGAPVTKRQPQPGQSYVGVHVAQTHWLDIPEYLAVLSTPEVLENPAVTTAVLEVVQEKLNLWRTMDPDLLALLGGQPPPSQSMVAPPVPGAKSGTPAPKDGAKSKTPNPNMPPKATDVPAEMPNLPKNPATGAAHSPDAPMEMQ